MENKIKSLERKNEELIISMTVEKVEMLKWNEQIQMF